MMKICILWHMHQPDYRDPLSGRILLPWTFLHAVKDYGEMLRIVEEFPGIKPTFNLVPVMLEQLAAYADGWQQDVWLELAGRPPEALDDVDRAFLLKQFFSVDRGRHILPQRRYAELAAMAEESGKNAWQQFSEADLLDLQTWFLLAWAGHFLRREAPVADLLAKGRDFTQQEKIGLLDTYLREVGSIVEHYRQLEQCDRIEISVTPYAHPILPLLCDTAIAAEASPGIALPQAGYLHPEDARLQVSYGLQLINRHLGERTRGIWPAEGALSEEAARILQQAGGSWAAGDEELLARSIPGGLHDRSRLYRPYSFAGLPLLFRDRELSDRIGFVYADWEPERAADDLLARLRQRAAHAPTGSLALILDGENCWERYHDNGYPFLCAFYRGLLEADDLQPVSCGDAVAATEPTPLKQLAPGSWINGDFRIWIGHPEENRAWDLLARARQDCLPQGLEVDPDRLPETLPESLTHLLHAEGSDWFWWYGDDHVTAQADIFDRLFRHHLEALYRAEYLPPPEALHRPIKPPRSSRRISQPAALFSPVIDGREGDFFEWLSAGRAELKTGGAMHGHLAGFSQLRYGYDRTCFYLRLDPDPDLTGLDQPETRLALQLKAGTASTLTWKLDTGDCALTPNGEGVSTPVTAARRAILEIAIPLQALQLSAGDHLELSISLQTAAGELGRWPAEGPLRLPYLGVELEAEQWYV